MRKLFKRAPRLTCILALCATAMTASGMLCPAASANALLPNGKETRLLLLLQGMKWQNNLNAHEIALVEKGLKSSNDIVGEEAINVVAIHRLTSLAPLLEGAAKTSRIAEITRKLVAQALHSSIDPIAYMRAEWVKHEKDVEWKESDGCGIDNSVRDVVGLIVITDAVKALRRGKISKFALQGLKLNSLEQKLLHYSKMTSGEAVDDIFERLKGIKIASTEEYKFVDVVESYGKPAVLLLIEKLSQQQDLKETTGYGVKLLLQPLADYVTVHTLDAANADKLDKLVNHLEQNGSPYLASEIPWLRKAVEYVTKADNSKEDADE